MIAVISVIKTTTLKQDVKISADMTCTNSQIQTESDYTEISPALP